MIEDFDGNSNALWTIFKDEAKSLDEVRILTLKEDMKSSLLFVRSYPICKKNSTILMRGPHRLDYFRLLSLHL